jgi:hypothetical protein
MRMALIGCSIADEAESHSKGILIMKRSVREPLSVVIFGDSDDENIVRLKCMLLKCGMCNFVKGCMEKQVETSRAGLFIVSRDSVSEAQRLRIKAEARRLAVPVLQL